MKYLHLIKSSKFIGLFIMAVVANFQFVTAQSNVSFSDESVFSSSATVDFKVSTVNAEWLSCSNYAPSDDNLQIKNIAALISAMNPDIIAL